MSLFAGIDNVNPPGVVREDIYFEEGIYVVETIIFKQGVSKKDNSSYTIAEVSVIEVVEGNEESNKVGDVVSWFVSFKHPSALSNVKGFVAANLGLTSREEINTKVTAGICDDASGGDGTAFAGTQVVATARKVATRSGGEFTKVTFVPAIPF